MAEEPSVIQDNIQVQVDIAGLKKDVSYLTTQAAKQEIKQDAIITKLDKMSFVKQSDYVKDQAKHDEWKTSVEARLNAAEPSIKFHAALSNRWTQFLIGSIIISAIYVIASQAAKFTGVAL